LVVVPLIGFGVIPGGVGGLPDVADAGHCRIVGIRSAVGRAGLGEG